tara:strand:+ start:70 stop:1854 length:1785 start_codon:yes stop_codon:yes gene_type:complete
MTKKANSNISKIVYLLGSQFSKVPLLVLSFIFLSSLDIIGLGLIVPYAALLIEQESSVSSILISFFENYQLDISKKQLVTLMGLLIVIIFFIKGILSVIINRYILKFSANQGVRLSTFLMKSYQNMAYSDFTRRNSSEYVYSINVLTSLYSLLVQAYLRIISETILIIFIFLLLAYNNPLILFLLITIVLGSILLYDLLFKKVLVKYGKLRNIHSTNQIQSVNEGISGFKEIRVLGKENYFYKKIKFNAERYAKFFVKSNLIITSSRYFLEFILIFFIVIIIMITVYSNIETASLLSTLALFGAATVRLAPSANQIITSINSLRSGENSVELLYNDISNLENVANENEQELINIRNYENIDKFKSIKLENSSFTYEGAKKISINNVNLKILRGETIGIIGPTGSGKTTLVDILLGLLKPSMGNITYNDKNFEENIKLWQSQIAYLPQEIFIMDSTLKQNITLDENINNNKLFDNVIKKANLDIMLGNLNLGANTIIGENGIRLSGGQRQRIALARAMYHERDVLIFDEATSALDNDIEERIMNEIKSFKGKKTIIIIAHRLSTLKFCDRIYRIENGEIAESGSYYDVIQRDDNK